MKRSRRGFTLIEMVVAIAASAFVFAAGTLLVVSSIRMQNHIVGDASRGNDARVVLTLIENLASEGAIAPPETEGNDVTLKNGNSDTVILKYDATGKKIYVGNSSAPLMEDVEGFSANVDNQLLKVQFKAGGEEFQTSVLCRTWDRAPELWEIKANLAGLVSSGKLTEQQKEERYQFISTAYGQLGSGGTFVDSSGAKTYFAKWYSDKCNFSWSEDDYTTAPWCGCFVSWCIDQQAKSLEYTPSELPKFSHVEDGVNYFIDVNSYVLPAGAKSDVIPGDVIFFDKDHKTTQITTKEELNDTNSVTPDHTGIVLQVKDGTIYTIEGNRNGRVAFGIYPAEDSRIIGFGQLKWKETSE